MEDEAEAGEGAASQDQGGTPEWVSTARITGGCGRIPEDMSHPSFPASTPLPGLRQMAHRLSWSNKGRPTFSVQSSAPFSTHSNFSRALIFFFFLFSQRRYTKERCSIFQEKCSTVKKNTYKQSGEASSMRLTWKAEVSDSLNRIHRVHVYCRAKLLGC